MHVRTTHVLPVLASVLDLADNFFYFICVLPLVANLSHVPNIFF